MSTEFEQNIDTKANKVESKTTIDPSQFTTSLRSLANNALEGNLNLQLGDFPCVDTSILEKIYKQYGIRSSITGYAQTLDDGNLIISKRDGGYAVTWIDKGLTTKTGGGQIIYVNDEGKITGTDNNSRTKKFSEGEIVDLVLGKVRDISITYDIK